MGNTFLQEGPFERILYHETSRQGRGALSGHAPSKKPPPSGTLTQEAKILALVAACHKTLIWAWGILTRQVTFDRSGYVLVDCHPA
jgi:hypothetical protein